MDLKQDVFQEIANFLKVSPDELSEDSTIGKVDNWDSIGHLNMMMQLSQKFGFEVDAGVLAEHQSIGEILKLIESQNG